MSRTNAAKAAFLAATAVIFAASARATPIDDTITSAIPPAQRRAAPETGRFLPLAEIRWPDPAHPANLALRAAVDSGYLAGTFIGDLAIGSPDQFNGLTALFSRPGPGGRPVLAIRVSPSTAEALAGLHARQGARSEAGLARLMADGGISLDLSVPVDWHRLRDGAPGRKASADDVAMAAANRIAVREAHGIRSVIALPGVLANPVSPDGEAATLDISHADAAQLVARLADSGPAAISVTGTMNRAGGSDFLAAAIGWRGAVAYSLPCAAGAARDAAIPSDSILMLEGDGCSDPALLALVARELSGGERPVRGARLKVERLATALASISAEATPTLGVASPHDRRRMR